MRLIDADGLRLMKVEECAGHTIEYAAGWKACVEWIKTQPSAQPDIVRCEDCKNSSGKIANRTKCGLHNWWVGFDYFCADGERKEKE